MVDVEIEVPAVDVVLADQLGLIGLVDRGLQALALADELAADVDVAGVRAHGEAGDQAALDQQMRIVPHDLAVLAGAGLGLVGIDDEIVRPAVRLLGHERPFEAGREAGAAAAAQAGRLHLVDDASRGPSRGSPWCRPRRRARARPRGPSRAGRRDWGRCGPCRRASRPRAVAIGGFGTALRDVGAAPASWRRHRSAPARRRPPFRRVELGSVSVVGRRPARRAGGRSAGRASASCRRRARRGSSRSSPASGPRSSRC